MTFNKFIYTLLITTLLFFTACENTKKVESIITVTVDSSTSVSDTTTQKREITNTETSVGFNNIKMQAESTISRYENILQTYSQILINLLIEEPFDYTVMDMEAPAMLRSTDVGFIDINADDVPELIVGRGHGTNGINRQILYNTDGTLAGEFSTNYDGTVFVNDSWYAVAQSNGYVIYTKLCDGMPWVYLDWRSDDTYGAVYVKQPNLELQELGKLSYADAARVCWIILVFLKNCYFLITIHHSCTFVIPCVFPTPKTTPKKIYTTVCVLYCRNMRIKWRNRKNIQE